VYWANDSVIGRANPDGTGVDPSFIVPDGGPPYADPISGVAVDGAHVYWQSGSSIGRANHDGTGVEAFITGLYNPGGVAVDGAHVYWTDDRPFGHPSFTRDDAIGRARLDGTRVDQAFISFSRTAFPAAVAVDRAHVYWASEIYQATYGSIARADLDGTDVDQRFITLPERGSRGVAADGTYVYWSNFLTGSIGRAKVDGTSVDNAFITGADQPWGVAVGGDHVYWVNQGTNAIGRANLDGTGADPSFITGAGVPSAVAVDVPNEFSFGKVKKAKRTGTAKLIVKVPGLGELELAKNKEVKGKVKVAEEAGKETLRVKPRRNTKKRLNRRGTAKVTANVTYTPNGGQPNTQSKKIKLIKR
jgi:hypothetical protein